MKKKANKRAFFVCIAICLLYISVAVKLPDKLSFKRVSGTEDLLSNSISLASEEKTENTVEHKEIVPVKTIAVEHGAAPKAAAAAPRVYDIDKTEPELFMSVPIVCFAIKERLIEKEGLVQAGKDESGNITWKKPLDILKEKDEEGLRNLAKSIGTKNILVFFKKEGIVLKEKIPDEDMMLGKGYYLEKNKLLAIYQKNITEDCNTLFPFIADGKGISRSNGSYAFIYVKKESKNRPSKNEHEWQMPNLVNLPARQAVEKLIAHTSRIKVMGSGNVVEQYPKPFERIRGDAECIIYGRMSK